MRHDAPHAESITRGYLSLIQALEAKGVTRLYTPEFPGSEILNFYARERIIASRVTAERYPPNFQALERDPEPAFLFLRGTDRLTPTLKVLGASQETEQIGGYDMIRHVRPVERRYRQVLPVLRTASPRARAGTGRRPHHGPGGQAARPRPGPGGLTWENRQRGMVRL